MSYSKHPLLKWILAVLLTATCNSLWAQDAEEDEGAESAPQSLEEGAEMLASQSETDSDWTKEVTKINSKDEKIKEHTKAIKALIRQKKNAKSESRKRQIIHEMLGEYEKLKVVIGEYNNLQPKIRYRYPAEGKVLNRRYVPMRLQSLEQMEKELGLDSELTRIRKMVQRKYSSFVKEEVKVERHTASEGETFTQKEADEAVTKKRITLER